MTIHPTAVIHSSAVIHPTSVVSPFVVIGPKVKVSEFCFIGPFTSIGMKPDMRHDKSPGIWWEEQSSDWNFAVEIGNHSIIKEHVSIHSGTHRPTYIGNNCYIMPKVHIGHDVLLIGDCTLSPSAQLAGHVVVGRGATLGMSVIVHQRVKIGPGSMVGMGTEVRKNVPVFSKVLGAPQKTVGLNLDYLKKISLSPGEISDLKHYLVNQVGNLSKLNPRIQDLINEYSSIELGIDQLN